MLPELALPVAPRTLLEEDRTRIRPGRRNARTPVLMDLLVSLGTLVGIVAIGLVILGDVMCASREETGRTRRGDAIGVGSEGADH